MTKRNAQDSTNRNVRAANTKIADLTRRVRALETWMRRFTRPIVRGGTTNRGPK